MEIEIIEKFIQEGWHEKDCPAHSSKMGRENECSCLYGFVVELLGGKIKNL